MDPCCFTLYSITDETISNDEFYDHEDCDDEETLGSAAGLDMRHKVDDIWNKRSIISLANGNSRLKDITDNIWNGVSDKEYVFLCVMQHSSFPLFSEVAFEPIHSFACGLAIFLNSIMCGKPLVLNTDRVLSSLNKRRISCVPINQLEHIRYRFRETMAETGRDAEQFESVSLQVPNVLPRYLITVAVEVVDRLRWNPHPGNCLIVANRTVKTIGQEKIIKIEKRIVISCESMLVEVVLLTCPRPELENCEGVLLKLSQFFCGFSRKHIKKACKTLRKTMQESVQLDELFISRLVPRSPANLLVQAMEGIEELNDSLLIHLHPDNPNWQGLSCPDDPHAAIFNNYETKHFFLVRRTKASPEKVKLIHNMNPRKWSKESLESIFRGGKKIASLAEMLTPSGVQMQLLCGDKSDCDSPILPDDHSSPQPNATNDLQEDVHLITQAVFMNWKLLENILTDNCTENSRHLLNYLMGGGHLIQNTSPLHWRTHSSLLFKKGVFEELVAGDNKDVFITDLFPFDNKINDLLWSARAGILNENWWAVERALEEKVHCLVSFEHLINHETMSNERIEKTETYFRYCVCPKLRSVWRSLWLAKLTATISLRGLCWDTLDSMMDYWKRLMILAHPVEFTATIPVIQHWYSSLVYLALCLPKDELTVIDRLNDLRVKYSSRLEDDNCVPLIEMVLWAHGLGLSNCEQLLETLMKPALNLASGMGFMYLVCAVYIMHTDNNYDVIAHLLVSYKDSILPADISKLYSLMKQFQLDEEAHQLLMSVPTYDIDPGDELIVDYCVESLALCDKLDENETHNTLASVASLLLAFLDFSCNGDNCTAWKLLASSLKDLFDFEELGIEIVNLLQSLWNERRDWWILFHSKTLEQDDRSLKRSKKKVFKFLRRLESLNENDLGYYENDKATLNRSFIVDIL